MSEPKGLHAKLAEVMAEAGRIPKNGKAPAQMGGFAFVQVGDAADAIRKSLGERGVSMLPSAVEVIGEAEHETKSGGTMTTQTIRTTWTLTDGETGQTAVIQSLGTGADTGDKFSPKAQTNAMKYALLMGFLLSTGDDPELHDSGDRVRADVERSDDGGLVGTIEAGSAATSDFLLRQTPDGSALGFRLRGTRGGILVQTRGILAEQLIAHKAQAVGAKVTCWGRITDVPGSQNPPRRGYQVLAADRVRVPGLGDLPTDTTPEPSGAPDGSSEPTEAPSEPLFDEATQAEMDATLDSILGVTS